MDSPHLYILTIIQSQSILQSTGQVQSYPFENFFLTVLTHIDFPLFQIYYILININLFLCMCYLIYSPKQFKKAGIYQPWYTNGPKILICLHLYNYSQYLLHKQLQFKTMSSPTKSMLFKYSILQFFFSCMHAHIHTHTHL